MYNLSFPIPVALFLRRLFNVVSLTISNQYLLVLKSELDRKEDAQVHRGPSDIPKRPLTGTQGRMNYSLSETGCRVTYDTKETTMNEGSASIKANETVPSAQNSSYTSKAPLSTIQILMMNPTLFDPVRRPRNPIVLCHGLYGYDVRGPSSFPLLQSHYWGSVLKVLRDKIGAEVLVTGVPGTGSIASRSEKMNQYLKEEARGREINFMAHSMGGLDCRHLITHVKPKDYTPVSLTSICTPHRGSPFMDWCMENIGIGKFQREAKEATEAASGDGNNTALFSSLTTYLLSVFDSPAYANLSTHYLNNEFNPTTPDDPRVRYYSVAARTDAMSVFHPLWLPKTVLDESEKQARESHPNPESEEWGHDGLVSVRSARWGEFLGILEGCDHWDVRGARGLGVTSGGDRDWHVNIHLPAGILNSLSDPLNYKEWIRLLGIKRNEERKEREKEKGDKSVVSNNNSSQDPQATANAKKFEIDDIMLRSSTEKVSALIDWATNQVTSASVLTTRGSESEEEERRRVDSVKKKESGEDPRLKFDLERLYVSLCRKLYDDGL